MQISNSYHYALLPIGGVGRIGANMTLLKTPTQWIVIDTGISFPDNDAFNIKYLVPNFESLKDQPVTDLVLTHGHEDHIGAISHFIQLFPEVRIWAPPFCAKLIQNKLANFPLNTSPKIEVYEENSLLSFETLNIFPIHVNHSIPDTYGLLIQDKKALYSCFYLSDFKYDEKNPYEKPLNLKKLKELSQHSFKRLFFVDSTNILNSGKTPSEGDLIPFFDDLFKGITGRIFVTFFPSNIYRMQTLLEMAKRYKKKVAYGGKSMQKYAQMAHELKILKGHEETFIDFDSLRNEEEEVIILLSGSQGDARGTLKRIAYDEHPNLKLKSGDTVLFSSKTIPGNEISIINLVNKIYEKGAKILNHSDGLFHSSGHASQEDLKIVIQHFNPTDYFPIHGETYFLSKHIEFVKNHFPNISTHFIQNFHEVVLGEDGKILLKPNTPLAPIFIHGNYVPLDKKILNQRKKLAQNGILFLSIQNQSNQAAGEYAVKLSEFGIPEIPEEKKQVLGHLIQKALREDLKNLKEDNKEEQLKALVRRFFENLLGYRPLVQVHFF